MASSGYVVVVVVEDTLEQAVGRSAQAKTAETRRLALESSSPPTTTTSTPPPPQKFLWVLVPSLCTVFKLSMSVFASRPTPSTMTDASRTVTLLETEHTQNAPPAGDSSGTLRLRGAPRTRTRETQRVVWRDDVVDNEGAGKKSSKSESISPNYFDRN